jgi:hypothetical protein
MHALTRLPYFISCKRPAGRAPRRLAAPVTSMALDQFRHLPDGDAFI